jgi:hypothetical protein
VQTIIDYHDKQWNNICSGRSVPWTKGSTPNMLIRWLSPRVNATFILLLTIGTALPCMADHLTGGATGLTNPSAVITFDELGNLQNQVITTQFAPFGVTFENFGWDGATFGQAGSIGFLGGDLVNGFAPFPTAEPMIISFTTAVTAAAFAALDQNAAFALSAYLGGAGGTLVDSFDIVIPSNPGAGFIGFANETFDTIVITPLTTSVTSIDSLELQSTAVPEPASVALFSAALLMSTIIVRRSAARSG